MLELSDDVVGEDPQRRMLKPVRLLSDDEDEEDEDEQELDDELELLLDDPEERYAVESNWKIDPLAEEEELLEEDSPDEELLEQVIDEEELIGLLVDELEELDDEELLDDDDDDPMQPELLPHDSS